MTFLDDGWNVSSYISKLLAEVYRTQITLAAATLASILYHSTKKSLGDTVNLLFANIYIITGPKSALLSYNTGQRLLNLLRRNDPSLPLIFPNNSRATVKHSQHVKLFQLKVLHD